MLNTSQVDPISTFHEGFWTSDSREKNFQSLPNWARSRTGDLEANISFLFIHFRSQGWIPEGFPKHYFRTWKCTDQTVDIVTFRFLARVCLAPDTTLLAKGREWGHVHLFNRVWTINYTTKHSTKLIIQSTSRMWYKWCKCVNSE